MMDAGLHMTTALSASWLPWVCLAMVMLVWLCCVLQPQYLKGLVSNGFSAFTVNAAEQIPSVGSQIAQWLFNCIVPSIGFFVMLEQEVVQGGTLLAWLIGLEMLADVVRLSVALMVQYTFRLGKLMNLAYLRYFSLRSLFTFVLFTIMLLVNYTTPHMFWLSLLGVASVIYMITLGWQWGRLFCNSFVDVAGLLVYLFTVELLPALLLLEAGRELYFLHIS